MAIHIPVLLRELVENLDPQKGDAFVDCTLGEGGHARAFLEKIGKDGILLGIEKDKELLAGARKRLKHFRKNAFLVRGDYRNFEKIVRRAGFKKEFFKGIYFDLGICLWQIKEAGRGFSFQKNEFLDMRYDQSQPLRAYEILNSWPKREIISLLKNFGEEPFAEKIADKICQRRKQKPLQFTQELIAVIKEALPPFAKKRKIHFATRTFQALRIAVNQEINALKIALPQTIDFLKKRGRLAVITYHSLEERVVKRFQKDYQESLSFLTSKPFLRPSLLERQFNPSSRSAKLWLMIKK